jgi:hypothetical protein
MTCDPECEMLRAENERLRTEVGLLTQILQLEFARQMPDRRKQIRKVHEIINSLQHGFHKK